jgi:hypothetical protein
MSATRLIASFNKVLVGISVPDRIIPVVLAGQAAFFKKG